MFKGKKINLNNNFFEIANKVKFDKPIEIHIHDNKYNKCLVKFINEIILFHYNNMPEWSLY